MGDSSEYALGYTDVEHQRLMRQAERWRSSTERFFRDAGLSEGLRVLDLGSGIGDVAMLAAHIVGTTGAVVGVERDPRSAERARVRAAEEGLTNLAFVEADVAAMLDEQPFDALVGRFILQFLPDPVAVLRNVLRLVRPGGIVAFQEVSWSPTQAANGHLRLWSACASVTRESIDRTGANTDIGLALRGVFLDAGIPEPEMQVEMKMGASQDLVLWVHDLFVSVHSAGLRGDRALDELGDLTTLPDRLEAEVRGARSAVTSIAAVGARSRLFEP